MQGVAIVVCLSVTLVTEVSGSAINYCGARMCGNTDSHTFCQYPEGPSYRCVGYINADLSNEEKSRIIARLNRRRNEAAAGRLRGLASAGNMLKLRWVEELAREAQRWADQCRPPTTPEEHDSCRDLYSVSVGQCVASVVGEAPGLRIESMVDIWYMQNMLYKGNATIYMLPSQNSSYYGDFGQMMWAQSYMVGCGRSRFMTPWQGRLRSVERLVCNIAPRGPPPARPLWSPSAPATLCPARSKQDKILTSLCDIQKDSAEINEVDATMTLEEHLLLYTVLDIEGNNSLTYPGSLDEIYLTRLTVATMGNIISTEGYFNSIQRRDITENIYPVEKTSNSNISYTQADVSLESNSTTVPTYNNASFQTITKILAKQKTALIGRPKPYNMEELNDLDYTTENYSPVEDIHKREKEFYAEYEFVESMEENSTASMDITESSSLPEVNYDNISSTEIVTEIHLELIKENGTDLYQNESMLYEPKDNSLNSDDQNMIYNVSEVNINSTQTYAPIENTSQVLKDVEDYLTDPETVRELQEALDRMEQESSTEVTTERQAKVRRALRDSSDAMRSIDEREQKSNELSAELARNRSLDRGPMYNMVLKYMPYLKEYEGGLLSQTASTANRLTSSFVLVVLFCL